MRLPPPIRCFPCIPATFPDSVPLGVFLRFPSANTAFDEEFQGDVQDGAEGNTAQHADQREQDDAGVCVCDAVVDVWWEVDGGCAVVQGVGGGGDAPFREVETAEETVEAGGREGYRWVIEGSGFCR